MNFLKAYTEKVVGNPLYESDYTYYLFEMFVKEYIPKIIEECIISGKTQVSIAIRDVVDFYRKVIKRGVEEAVKSGKIKQEDVNKKVNDFSGKTIKNATEYLCDLPFSTHEGFITGDLMAFINFYYEELQYDVRLLPKTEIDIKQSNLTFSTFKTQVVSYITSLVEECKTSNKKKITIPYTIINGKAIFGKLELEGLNLYEFGRYINMIPHKDLTNYAGSPKNNGDNLRNCYKFEYTIEDLEKFSTEGINKLEKQRLRQKKLGLQILQQNNTQQMSEQNGTTITR